jgi:hypothetical protein
MSPNRETLMNERKVRDMNMDKNMRDEIASIAYSLYEKRGHVSGNDFADWIEAEKIVAKKYSKERPVDTKTSKSAQPVRAMERTKSRIA